MIEDFLVIVRNGLFKAYRSHESDWTIEIKAAGQTGFLCFCFLLLFCLLFGFLFFALVCKDIKYVQVILIHFCIIF